MRSDIFDVMLDRTQGLLRLSILILLQPSFISLRYWSEIGWHILPNWQNSLLIANRSFSLKVKLLVYSKNYFWCFSFLNISQKIRLSISLNIGLWRYFLILGGIICYGHKRLIEHIFFNKAVVTIVVELSLIHWGVETKCWIVKIIWFRLIVALLFERTWGNQFERIPCSFVYSLCTNVSQGIIWVFYNCVVKLQPIEFFEKFWLLLKNISNLRLEKVHLINEV